MTGEDLARLARDGVWNAYYLAYAIETGAADPKAAFKRDGGNHEFSFWIMDRWREIAKAEKMTTEFVGSLGAVRMNQHLAERLGDKLDAYAAALKPWFKLVRGEPGLGRIVYRKTSGTIYALTRESQGLVFYVCSKDGEPDHGVDLPSPSAFDKYIEPK